MVNETLPPEFTAALKALTDAAQAFSKQAKACGVERESEQGHLITGICWGSDTLADHFAPAAQDGFGNGRAVEVAA